RAENRASGEEEKPRGAAEEHAHADAFSAGGRSGRRAMAAATADESRAPRAGEMTAVAPAGIPLGHAPDDPGPNGETEAEPAPEPATPPPDGRGRLPALFRPELSHRYCRARITSLPSSPRRRGPIFQSRWLWVPACAGTTGRGRQVWADQPNSV